MYCDFTLILHKHSTLLVILCGAAEVGMIIRIHEGYIGLVFSSFSIGISGGAALPSDEGGKVRSMDGEATYPH